MEIVITFLVRLALVALFMPFSALDKIVDFVGAERQAMSIGIPRWEGAAMIAGGFTVELFASTGVLTGFADRLSGLVLALYCVATALLYKRFWAADDLRLAGPSKGRELFWDFWKNVAVSGGFLLVTFGTTAPAVQEAIDALLASPFASTNPYG